jgi:S-adenosyl-L-methionine hydrolase (adenosine-forming)
MGPFITLTTDFGLNDGYVAAIKGVIYSDIHERLLPPAGQSVTIKLAGTVIRGLAQTYAGAEGPVALVGSSGYLEIALDGNSAAAFLKVKIDDEIRVITWVDHG